MRFNFIIFGIFTAALLLASACQPLERPFQPRSKASWKAAPGPRASLYVAPVLNGPEDLNIALSKKLQDLGIAAFTDAAPVNRYHVESHIFIKENASYVLWRIIDPNGQDTQLETIQQIGQIVEGPNFVETDYETALLHSASEIDIMLGGSGTNFEALKKPVIHVPVIKNAPGDGSETLSAAIQNQIAQFGIDVLPEPWGATYLVKGEVHLSKPQAGSQVVSILWKLERQNGEFVGKVEQKNRIRAGTLDGPWGVVAIAAAKGGARGIMKLLRTAEPAFFDRKS